MITTERALILGGSGYVAGELLRLLAGHPRLTQVAVVSESQGGQAVEAAFPHLAGSFPGLAFARPEGLDALLGDGGSVAVFSAAPHGAAAALADRVLTAAERAGTEILMVDLSADFRFRTAEEYAAVYGHGHGAPHRLAEFTCALPEHLAGVPGGKLSHPGCFTSATLLAAVPLLALDLIEPEVTVVATTGSTGSGRTPTATTHHPERNGNLFAYKPLAHRHQPEMEALAAAASGRAARFGFVPQSGPFARGIYATLVAELKGEADAERITAAVTGFYQGHPFVQVGFEPPRLHEVVGTNRCHLGFAVARGELIAFSALDNLVKGAAGGAVQWMNRLLGLPETTGLTQPGLGWI